MGILTRGAWLVGLALAAAGASAGLGQQLEGALGGAEIREAQNYVGADDSH